MIPTPQLMELDPAHPVADPIPANGIPGSAPRVTVSDIHERIAKTRYFVDGRLTVCVITMKNGFKVVGESSCVSDENFNQALGEKYAFENAFEKLWALEGYLLRNRLYESSIAEPR